MSDGVLTQSGRALNNLRKPVPPKLRFRVFERDGFRCRYCGEPGSASKLEVDHLVARSRGGPDDFSNYITACRTCNIGKFDSDPSIRVCLLLAFIQKTCTDDILRDPGAMIAATDLLRLAHEIGFEHLKETAYAMFALSVMDGKAPLSWPDWYSLIAGTAIEFPLLISDRRNK